MVMWYWGSGKNEVDNTILYHYDSEMISIFDDALKTLYSDGVFHGTSNWTVRNLYREISCEISPCTFKDKKYVGRYVSELCLIIICWIEKAFSVIMYAWHSGHYIIILTHCQCCLMRIGYLQPVGRLAMIFLNEFLFISLLSNGLLRILTFSICSSDFRIWGKTTIAVLFFKTGKRFTSSVFLFCLKRTHVFLVSPVRFIFRFRIYRYQKPL